MKNQKNTSEERVRIDKWLWAARFFKTRQLAVKALKTGKVTLNGNSCKPASSVKLADTLCVKRGFHTLEINVLGLSENRGPAPIAQQLYEETQSSIDQRATLSEQLANQPKIDIDSRKPDKRGVRSHRAIKRGE